MVSNGIVVHKITPLPSYIFIIEGSTHWESGWVQTIDVCSFSNDILFALLLFSSYFYQIEYVYISGYDHSHDNSFISLVPFWWKKLLLLLIFYSFSIFYRLCNHQPRVQWVSSFVDDFCCPTIPVPQSVPFALNFLAHLAYWNTTVLSPHLFTRNYHWCLICMSSALSDLEMLLLQKLPHQVSWYNWVNIYKQW